MQLNPGDVAPKTGEFRLVDESGNTIGSVHVSAGDRMPPCQSSGQHYEIE